MLWDVHGGIIFKGSDGFPEEGIYAYAYMCLHICNVYVHMHINL